MYTKRKESRQEQIRSFKTLVMTANYVFGLLYGPSLREPILPPIPEDLNKTNARVLRCKTKVKTRAHPNDIIKSQTSRYLQSYFHS